MKNYRTNKILSLLLVALLVFAFVPKTHAAALASLSDTMTRIRVSQTSNHDIHFQVITAMSAGTFTLNFNTTSFSSGSVDYTDIDLRYGSSSAQVYGSCSSSCTEATLAGTAGAATWGAAFATNTLTFTYPTSGGTAIAANDYIRIEIGDNATTGVAGNAYITNPGTPGSKSIAITFPSDSGTIAVPIATEDQVVISATVDPNITFSLSATAVSLGTMTTGAVAAATPAITLTMGTNAVGGYVVTIQDEGSGASDGLYKAAAPTRLIDSNSADLSAGTEGYGVGVAAGTGTPTIVAPYNQGGTNPVGALQRTPQNMVSYGGPTGAVNQTATMTVRAAISASTPAGAYADTLTLIMTGNF